MYRNTWDSFFDNPILGSYLTEAEGMEPPQEAPSAPEEQPQVDEEQIQQLQTDFQSGGLSQEDLVSMYKSGKITKNDISTIVQGPSEEGEAAPTDGEEGPTEEELFAQQLDQTNDMFIKFTLYDKTTELIEKLNYFSDNFDDIQSDTYEKTVQLKEFLNILSNLIFNIETSVAYQMYGSILLQLTEIFTEYNNSEQAEELRDRIKDKDKDKYRRGEVTADPVKNWANENQSAIMPDKGQSNGVADDTDTSPDDYS
jgi:hypothetical protein